MTKIMHLTSGDKKLRRRRRCRRGRSVADSHRSTHAGKPRDLAILFGCSDSCDLWLELQLWFGIWKSFDCEGRLDTIIKGELKFRYLTTRSLGDFHATEEVGELGTSSCSRIDHRHRSSSSRYLSLKV